MEDEGKDPKIEEEEEAMEDGGKDPKIEEVEPVLRNPKHHLFVKKTYDICFRLKCFFLSGCFLCLGFCY